MSEAEVGELVSEVNEGKKKETTIRLSTENRNALGRFKLVPRESYDDAVSRLINEHKILLKTATESKELNEETKKILLRSLANIDEGKVVSMDQLLERLKENRKKRKTNERK